jgi:broad specificity phosphatase PhoE
MEKVHAEDTIVVCTHGGCMVVLEAALTGAWVEMLQVLFH